ncbi:hypothetical protein PsorP6_011112 [Peronosclerospora sorghi]|uniref:Uncharacterized protein n=1 Tax=Peronosclerospora sorghi TaxID=230839 RepID=A0ACC0VWY8_9STRA|nr:hypothetical protein PsorP6_011112 [Peronosclerospora sorghi]
MCLLAGRDRCTAAFWKMLVRKDSFSPLASISSAMLDMTFQIPPQNAEGLFNLRHSSLRNAVERIFGVLKKRFPILAKGYQYPVKTQVKLVYALTAIHNFIIEHSGEDDVFFWNLNLLVGTIKENRPGTNQFLSQNDEMLQ